MKIRLPGEAEWQAVGPLTEVMVIAVHKELGKGMILRSEAGVEVFLNQVDLGHFSGEEQQGEPPTFPRFSV